MSLIIKLLIGFFSLLLFYQLFIKNSCIEGLEQQQYKNYDQNDALILARQNAGNIEVLRGQLNELSGVRDQLTDLSGNLYMLEEKVIALVEQQDQMATDLTGGTAPEVTGATEEDTMDEDLTTGEEGYANYRRNYLL